MPRRRRDARAAGQCSGDGAVTETGTSTASTSHRLGQKRLELAVLRVERLQTPRVQDLPAAEARALRVERR